jgi:hypothetical protein
MDFDSQEKILEQRRARYLQQQNIDSPDGRMVGGSYIPTHPLESLAAGLRAYGGMRGEQFVKKELGDLRTKRQGMDADAMSKFTAALRGTPAQDIQPLTPMDDEGNVMPMARKEAVAPDPMAGYAALMEASNPIMKQAGIQGLARMPELEAKRQETKDAREARAQELLMRLNDQRVSQQEKIQAQRELQQMQIDARKDMQRMIASTRQAPQAQIIQTDTGPMQLVGGRAMPIVGPNGAPISAPKKGTAGLSATAQKELFEADDAVQNGLGAVSSLKKAMELNNKAYSGVGAGARAMVRSNLPGASESADATIAMENIIKDQALTSMKSIFGGNPTEGERAVLMELQASANKTPKQREEILGRAMQAAKRRVDFNKQKGDALRGGTYMAEGGAPQFEQSGGGLSGADSQAAAWANANPNDPRAVAIKQRLGL